MPDNGTFLHYVIEDHDVRVICCDSVLEGRVQGGFCSERLSWIDDQLSAASDKPTIVALRHPPFGSGMSGSASNVLVEGGSAFAAILRRHSQVVRVIAGHAHRPFTCAFGGTIGYAAPTTCYPFALEMDPEKILSIIDEPPAISVHLWMEDTGVEEPGLVTHTVPIGAWGSRRYCCATASAYYQRPKHPTVYKDKIREVRFGGRDILLAIRCLNRNRIIFEQFRQIGVKCLVVVNHEHQRLIMRKSYTSALYHRFLNGR